MAAAGQQLPGKLGEIQKQVEQETSEIKKIETGKQFFLTFAEYQKVFSAKQSLVEKKSENEMVL